MRPLTRSRIVTVLLALAGPVLAQQGGGDPIDPARRRYVREHSADSITIMQSHYGPGQTIFRGTPSSGATHYGATLLPHRLPAGTWRNQAAFPLQLSVQATAMPGNAPCYNATATVGNTLVGSAVGTNCNSPISSFTVTVPAGQQVTLENASASVLALASGDNVHWRNTQIRFEISRSAPDASGCTLGSPSYTGQVLYSVLDNWDERQTLRDGCPDTLLSPPMPPDYIPQDTRDESVRLYISPIARNGVCNVRVIQRATGEALLNTGNIACTSPPLQVTLPPNTSFSLSGGHAQVLVLGRRNATWDNTGIFFPVAFSGYTYGDCREWETPPFRERWTWYTSNRSVPRYYMFASDTVPCN